MKRHLTKSVYILACSAGVFFGCANVFARESAMLKLPKRGGNGGSPREREGGGKREKRNHICSVKTENPPEHNLLASKKNVLEQAAFLHEVKVV